MSRKGDVTKGLAEVMAVVGPLYRRATRSLEGHAATTGGIRVGPRAVLELVLATGALPVPRIADTLQLSRQFVQRSVDEGVEQGWLTLEANPAHRRSSLVVATAAGHDLMARVHRRERDLLRDAGGDLTADEVAACLRVLRTLHDRIAWE